MAIEDIIWGKNKHIFGGVEPHEVTDFNASVLEPGNMELTINIPEDTVYNNQTLCTVAGVVVRGSFTEYPKDELSGILMGDYSESGTYIVNFECDDEKMMYLSAFSYSDQGVFNKNAKQLAVTINSGRTYLYGFDLVVGDSNPDSRVLYPSDVDNHYYNQAILNNLNDWNIAPGEKFMPRPCMLKYDGTVDYYLNPNDYTKKADGTASDISNPSYSGNAMMEWPKIYTKRWVENEMYHFRCSDHKVDDDYECWCNYDVNNNEIDHFYTGIYFGCVVSSKTRSLSKTKPTYGVTFENEVTSARSNNQNEQNWNVECLADHLLIQDLLVMIGKNTNAQKIFGYGIKSNSSSYLTGSLDSKGLFYSGSNSSSSSMKIFGMEDYWGGYGRRLLGLFNDVGQIYVKITLGTKDGTTVNNFSTGSASGYIKAVKYPYGSNTGGYVSTMTMYSWGRLASAVSGSSSTYECDYADLYATDSIKMRPLIIGNPEDSTAGAMGPFMYWSRYNANGEYAFITSRLSCKPIKK